mgnify:CR=1 FL=1
MQNVSKWGEVFGPQPCLFNSPLLSAVRVHDSESFKALWLSAGSRLTLDEIDFVRWEHFTLGPGGFVLRFIGPDRTAIEAPVALAAVEALLPFWQADGLVIESTIWRDTLHLLLTIGHADIDALRAMLNPQPVVRRLANVRNCGHVSSSVERRAD